MENITKFYWINDKKEKVPMDLFLKKEFTLIDDDDLQQLCQIQHKIFFDSSTK